MSLKLPPTASPSAESPPAVAKSPLAGAEPPLAVAKSPLAVTEPPLAVAEPSHPGAESPLAVEEPPPILGSWGRMYLLVLAALLLAVLLFAWLGWIYK